ncbi:MAG: vitamin B12 dependent-methionine synthase activation domain-containing protein [Bacteroidota bacterium]
MRRVLTIPIEEVTPTPGAILEAQGVPLHRHGDRKASALAGEALRIYRRTAEPAGILMEVSGEQFAEVFGGEGRNESDSPVEPIARAATSRALFACTVGEPVCREIAARFQERDFALGSMLDAAASCGAELAALALEHRCRALLRERGVLGPHDNSLRFSPGYCGWHISAQRRLFALAGPGDIGIELNESFLMKPLKSVTGTILSGPREIFLFEDTFPFCRECADHSCRERIRSIMDH